MCTFCVWSIYVDCMSTLCPLVEFVVFTWLVWIHCAHLRSIRWSEKTVHLAVEACSPALDYLCLLPVRRCSRITRSDRARSESTACSSITSTSVCWPEVASSTPGRLRGPYRTPCRCLRRMTDPSARWRYVSVFDTPFATCVGGVKEPVCCRWCNRACVVQVVLKSLYVVGGV